MPVGLKATGLAVEGRVLLLTEPLARALAEAAELLEERDSRAGRRRPAEVAATLRRIRWWAREDAGARFDANPFPPPFPWTETLVVDDGNRSKVNGMGVTEVAVRLDLTSSRVRQFARAGTLHGEMLEGRWRFDPEGVETFAQQRGQR